MTCNFVRPRAGYATEETLEMALLVNLELVQAIATGEHDDIPCVIFLFAVETKLGGTLTWEYLTEEARDADWGRLLSAAGCS